MPGSRVNLGNGGHNSSKRPAMKKSKGNAMKKSKGGAAMKPPGMKNGGGLEMTEVGGKKVPKFAADGKGAKDLMKKTKGGAVKKAKGGALMKKKKPTGG
tara:strand:+ start:482 stop:778 length:297 start_codon:yes stop_codon:yes gene_type:complete